MPVVLEPKGNSGDSGSRRNQQIQQPGEWVFANPRSRSRVPLWTGTVMEKVIGLGAAESEFNREEEPKGANVAIAVVTGRAPVLDPCAQHLVYFDYYLWPRERRLLGEFVNPSTLEFSCASCQKGTHRSTTPQDRSLTDLWQMSPK
jgi:hypothetical protein